MAPEYQIKKFLGEVRGRRGPWFRVFSTGRAGWVLLASINEPGGWETGLHLAYKRSDFKRGVLPRDR